MFVEWDSNNYGKTRFKRLTFMSFNLINKITVSTLCVFVITKSNRNETILFVAPYVLNNFYKHITKPGSEENMKNKRNLR